MCIWVVFVPPFQLCSAGPLASLQVRVYGALPSSGGRCRGGWQHYSYGGFPARPSASNFQGLKGTARGYVSQGIGTLLSECWWRYVIAVKLSEAFPLGHQHLTFRGFPATLSASNFQRLSRYATNIELSEAFRLCHQHLIFRRFPAMSSISHIQRLSRYLINISFSEAFPLCYQHLTFRRFSAVSSASNFQRLSR